MTAAVDVLGQTTAGLRAGLILLAVMSLIARLETNEDGLLDLWRRRGGICLAVAVILYSPAHTAILLHYRVPPLAANALDLIATGLSCVFFIYLLAGRGLRRGLSLDRVRRGVIVNSAVLTAIVGAVWLTR